MSISAGELKKKGVSIIQTKLDKMNEETITVKGKDTFVVMNMEYQYCSVSVENVLVRVIKN